MSARPLTKKEILDLIGLVRDVFGYISRLKDKSELAEWIQYPKVPSILSESLVFHLVKDRILPLPVEDANNLKFRFRTKEGDILLEDKGAKIHIEVKATGKRKFQYLGEKDIKSDYLVWVNFEDFFENPDANQIEIVIFEKIGRYVKSPRKITLAKLEDETKQSNISIHIDLIKYLKESTA